MTEYNDKLLILHNGQTFDVSEYPLLAENDFRKIIIKKISLGWRMAVFFGAPAPAESGAMLRLYCTLANDTSGQLGILCTDINDSYPALTPDCIQSHYFEREIHEQWGILPTGHPWLKPVRFESNRLQTPPKQSRIGQTDFFRLEGEETHEVAVGPVHAGVIEPGHFRFQCHGETVYHLEISLGYQHRGIEQKLVKGPHKSTPYQIEPLAGDTTIGHMTSYCRMLEHLGNFRVPARGQAIRGIAAELERLANHVGDLGAMAGDIGFLPTMSYCGRLRGDILNMTAVLCGNRFGRGLVVPGGVHWDLTPRIIEDLLARLQAAERDITSAIDLMFNAPSVLARLENTGIVCKEDAIAIGLVGPAARACGLRRDVRNQFASGIYRFSSITDFVYETGDCFARAYIRWVEIKESIRFIRELLQALPGGEVRLLPSEPLQAGKSAIVLSEGWRGEICHIAATDKNGRFAFYKIVDPSFHNWFGLTLAMRNEQISDFPLCNKSFNLSYCGHDL